MSQFKTNLVVQAAPLPPNFRGTPQQFFEAIVDRMEIVSPFGFTYFISGPNKPSSNQGPWLKDGTQWWVWSDDAADYIPLDITESQKPVYVVAKVDPDTIIVADPDNGIVGYRGDPVGWKAVDGPNLWFRKANSGLTIDGIFFYINGKWQSLLATTGATNERPDNPVPFERFYDTTISAEIWWERGQWRTVSGSLGDVKFVSWLTGQEALDHNPGWEILGTGETENTAWHGCVIGQATKDSSGAVTQLSVNAPNVTEHSAGSVVGAETHVLTVDEMPVHRHGPATATHAANMGGDGIALHNTDLQAAVDSNWTADEGGDQAHSLVQPTLFLFALRKS